MKYFLLSRNWIKKKTLRFTRLLELSLNQFRLEWYLIKSYGNLFLLIIFWNRHPTSERNLIVAIDALKMMRKKLNIRARLSALVRRQKCFVSADCCNRRTSFRLSMARPNWLSFLDRFFLSHRIFIFFSLTLCCGEPMPDTVSMAGRLKSGEMKEKPRKGSKNWANKREGEREKETERERERERERYPVWRLVPVQAIRNAHVRHATPHSRRSEIGLDSESGRLLFACHFVKPIGGWQSSRRFPKTIRF